MQTANGNNLGARKASIISAGQKKTVRRVIELADSACPALRVKQEYRVTDYTVLRYLARAEEPRRCSNAFEGEMDFSARSG